MLARVLFWCSALAPAACYGQGVCYGLSVGDRLSIELLEHYDETSSFEFDLGRPVPPRCGREFDLAPPDVLNLRVVKHRDDTACDLNVVEWESAPPWDLGAEARAFPLAGDSGGNIMESFRNTTINGCQGRWGIQVQGRVEPDEHEGNPFLIPRPGEFPPIIMARGFFPNSMTDECTALLPEGARSCMDFFVVVVRRR